MEDDGFIYEHINVHNRLENYSLCNTDFFILFSNLIFNFINSIHHLPNYKVEQKGETFTIKTQNFNDKLFDEFNPEFYINNLNRLFSTSLAKRKYDLDFKFMFVEDKSNIKLICNKL